MEYLKLTNNEDEMVLIGKRIVEEKPEKYPDSVMNRISSTIQKNIPSAEREELEKNIFKSIYYYWVYGCAIDEYFYCRLYEKTPEEIKKYVTTREKLLYIDHLSRVEDAHILVNKWETYCLLGEYFKRDVIRCCNENDYPVFLEFIRKHPVFVVKPTDMGCGYGVYKESVEKRSDNEIHELFEYLLNNISKNMIKYHSGREFSFVLEELIDQDERLSALHPASVNSVRVTTVKIGDTVHIYEPFIKIGRGGNFLTSAIFGTMDAGIDVSTGIVDTPAVTEALEEFSVHPDTGAQILGFEIPRWDELKKLATELALKLPTIGYVGWDMVLTKENGWCVMEGNFRGDFMWQMYRKRGMKKEFEDLIHWSIDKEFWWK